MGCNSSTQTTGQEGSKPSAKPEETNGASTTGTANENGGIPEDRATLPDQTAAQPASEGPVDAAKAETTKSSNTGCTEAAAPASSDPAAPAPASSDAAAASTAQPEASGGDAPAEGASEEAAPASDAAAEASDKPAESAAQSAENTTENAAPSDPPAEPCAEAPAPAEGS